MAEHWKIEFTDIMAIDWKISVNDPLYSSDPIILQATGDPLTINHDNDSDDLFDPIRPTKTTFRVYSDTHFALTEFYSIEDKHLPVNISRFGITPYWIGFIETQNYSEEYEPVSYRVEVVATDGLDILKNILYAESIVYDDGKEIVTYHDGRIRESEIILDILGQIGHTTFYEFVNLYEDDMTDGVDSSPFDQTVIDVDVFKDFTCWDVLVEILKKYNAFIRQRNGFFYILRPVELGATTVYGRYFTDAITKTAVTLNPDQFINRIATHPSSKRLQVPGGVLMIEPPAKTVTVQQDYGNKQSWLDNWQFKGDTYRGSYLFDFWTNSGTPLPQPISNVINGENEGVLLTGTNHYPGVGDYIFQSFGINSIISATDGVTLEFDWLLYNIGADAVVGNIFYITIFGSGYFLHELNEDFVEWTATPSTITITADAPVGSSGWTTYKRKVIGLPDAGPYQIRIHCMDDTYPFADVRLGIKNVRFYLSSVSISTKSVRVMLPDPWGGQNFPLWGSNKWRYAPIKVKEFVEITQNEYVVNNNINGVNLVYEYKLGDVVDADMDNVIEQFGGALGVAKQTDDYKVMIVRLTGDSGLLELTCNGYTGTANFNTDLTVTATEFVDLYITGFDTVDILISSSNEDVIFTSLVLGLDFETTVENISGNLNGTVEETSPTYTAVLGPTDTWNSRGGTEAKPLLELIGDEIADQYARPKQLIQMPIMETAQDIQIDPIGNFQDDLNLYNGDVRVFVMNRGEFDVRNREWNVDLCEICTRVAEPEEPEETFEVIYGALYNWYAINDPRNICAAGWHIPTDAECATLYTFLGGDAIAGGELKETGFDHWASPNTGATNSTGFNGRGSGARIFIGFVTLTYGCNLWASDEVDVTHGVWEGLSYNDILFHHGSYTGQKFFGFSVRPIKDDDTLADMVGNDGKIYSSVKIGNQVWIANNLCETKYRNGDLIPEVQDQATWAALTTGAYCAYDNNIDNAYIEGTSGLTTADSTVVTVDSTEITVDEG
jgi:uncharacterized protein (TIGR02145 family)